jgi:hypothetical protein
MSDSHIPTSDLYFAAYLRVAGVPLVTDEDGQPVTKREGKRVIFLFERMDSAVFRDLKAQFYSDHARVPALSYSQAVKYMKGLVFKSR